MDPWRVALACVVVALAGCAAPVKPPVANVGPSPAAPALQDWKVAADHVYRFTADAPGPVGTCRAFAFRLPADVPSLAMGAGQALVMPTLPPGAGEVRMEAVGPDGVVHQDTRTNPALQLGSSVTVAPA